MQRLLIAALVLCLAAAWADEDVPRATFKTTFVVTYNSKTLDETVELERGFEKTFRNRACSISLDAEKVSGGYPARFKTVHTVVFNAKKLPDIADLEAQFRTDYSSACSIKLDLEKVGDAGWLVFCTNLITSTGMPTNVSSGMVPTCSSRPLKRNNQKGGRTWLHHITSTTAPAN